MSEGMKMFFWGFSRLNLVESIEESVTITNFLNNS